MLVKGMFALINTRDGIAKNKHIRKRVLKRKRERAIERTRERARQRVKEAERDKKRGSECGVMKQHRLIVSKLVSSCTELRIASDGYLRTLLG